jgi:GAF domain-containing protein
MPTWVDRTRLVHSHRGYFHARGDQVVPFLLSRTILNKVLHTRQSLRIFDASQDCDLNKQRSVAEGRVRSVLCAPLLASGQAVGVLYADTRSGVRIYGKEDLVFLGALGCLLGRCFAPPHYADLRRRNRELRRAWKAAN